MAKAERRYVDGARNAPIPKPPLILKGRRPLQASYRRVYESASWLGECDRDLVATLVIVNDLIRRTSETLADGDLVSIAGSGRAIQAPSVRTLFEASAEARRISEALALDTASRARLGLRQAQASSLLEKIRDRRITEAADQTIDVDDVDE